MLVGRHVQADNLLHTLNLSFNDLGPWGAATLSEGLAGNRSLLRLELEDCRLVQWGSSTVAGREGSWRSAFPRAKGWKKAGPAPPSADPLDMEGLAKLTAALGKNLKIQHVNMKWNQVGAEGAALVADMMVTNTTITSLLLAHNKVGKEGATALAAVLSSQVVRVEAYPQLLAVLGVTAVSRVVVEGEERGEGGKEGVG